jgi:hypothetical protein
VGLDQRERGARDQLRFHLGQAPDRAAAVAAALPTQEQQVLDLGDLILVDRGKAFLRVLGQALGEDRAGLGRRPGTARPQDLVAPAAGPREQEQERSSTDRAGDGGEAHGVSGMRATSRASSSGMKGLVR